MRSLKCAVPPVGSWRAYETWGHCALRGTTRRSHADAEQEAPHGKDSDEHAGCAGARRKARTWWEAWCEAGGVRPEAYRTGWHMPCQGATWWIAQKPGGAAAAACLHSGAHRLNAVCMGGMHGRYEWAQATGSRECVRPGNTMPACSGANAQSCTYHSISNHGSARRRARLSARRSACPLTRAPSAGRAAYSGDDHDDEGPAIGRLPVGWGRRWRRERAGA